MHTIPPKPSLVQYATTAVRDLIIRGKWANQLPGERDLSRALDISRPTLRAALLNMEREGLLARKWGAPWKITPAARRLASEAHTSRKDVSVCFLSPFRLEQMEPFMLYAVQRMSEHLGSHGIHVEIVAEPSVSKRDPLPIVFERLARHTSSIWLLLRCAPAVQQWFSSKMVPAVIIGSAASGVHLASVDMDYHATGFHAAGRLLSLGHRPERIVSIFPRDPLPGHEAALAGIREAMRPHEAAMRVVRVSKDHQNLCHELDQLITDLVRPTALMFMWPLHAVTAITHLGLRRSVHIPRDMSLISLDDDPLLRHVVPAISRYARNADLFLSKIIHEINHLIQDAAHKPAPVKMIPESIAGETLARPNGM